jgi:hypothetical protein
MNKNIILLLGWLAPLFSFAQCWVEVSDTLICDPAEINISATVDEAFWEQLNSYEVESIGFNPESVAKSSALAIGDDQILGPFPIGFTFNFFNQNYNQFWISSNGFISFLPETYGGYGVWDIPDWEGPYACVFGIWEDLNPGAGGEVKQASVGGKLIVDFQNVPSYNCGGDSDTSASFQIILNQGSNTIEIHTANKYDCTISAQGIQGGEGVFAFTPEGRNAENWSTVNDAVIFTPQSTASVSWYGDNNELLGEGVPLAIDAQETENILVVIDNGNGCTASDTFNLQVSIQTPIISQSGFVLLCDLAGFDYQWYLGGELMEGENAQFISPEEAGAYVVEVSDENGCISASVPFTYGATSLLEHSEMSFQVFPNPVAKGPLSCVVSEAGKLEVFDLNGEKISSQWIEDSQSIWIDVPSGVYVIHYSSVSGTKTTKKLIVY